jgi:predicted metalloprotease with PDZ domain
MTRAAAKKKRTPDNGSAVAPHYLISAVNPAAHLFKVTLSIDTPDPRGQHLALPVWIPGSYMVREFARHIVEIHAFAEVDRKRRALPLEKIDKTSWQAAACSGRLVIEYLVYAYDLSVRAAHLDTRHGFFNGTSVFLAVRGQELRAQRVTIAAPPDFDDWRVATTLPAEKLDENGFGSYLAENYDALIDHPVEMGTFLSLRFSACSTPHDVVITGPAPSLDARRLTSDLKRICEAQIKLFEPTTRRAPFSRYAFMTMMVDEGYGGLEHRSCTALMCARDGLPKLHQAERDDAYRTFLGVASHEYFHSWNVKRIKPAAFVPYRLDAENYTQLLWIFEGFTSYYDDLIMMRCGLLSEKQYLALLSKTIGEVTRSVGRTRQSVAQSSFDAWTKYYRQDENSPNAIVSYYRKGSLVALALDLAIRAKTRGKRSLDDVMRLLWQRFGKNFYQGDAQGLGEGEFAELVLEATGVNVEQSVRQWAYGVHDLPLAELFKPFGVALEHDAHHALPSLGIKSVADVQGARITHTYEGESAQRAGLAAGDVLIAIDQLKVTHPSLARVLKRYAAGQRVQVHAFRRDELLTFTLSFDQDVQGDPRLVALRSNRLRSMWLEENV